MQLADSLHRELTRIKLLVWPSIGITIYSRNLPLNSCLDTCRSRGHRLRCRFSYQESDDAIESESLSGHIRDQSPILHNAPHCQQLVSPPFTGRLIAEVRNLSSHYSRLNLKRDAAAPGNRDFAFRSAGSRFAQIRCCQRRDTTPAALPPPMQLV